jgi:hypothetical protein
LDQQLTLWCLAQGSAIAHNLWFLDQQQIKVHNGRKRCSDTTAR